MSVRLGTPTEISSALSIPANGSVTISFDFESPVDGFSYQFVNTTPGLGLGATVAFSLDGSTFVGGLPNFQVGSSIDVTLTHFQLVISNTASFPGVADVWVCAGRR